MKLCETNENTNYILLDTGDDAHFRRRASSMGLVADTQIHVVRNQKKMPVLIFARDTLIALNRKDSERIEVKTYA